MVGFILSTKLFIPSAHPAIIHRPHLIERLTSGLGAGHSLTLISAPAGYGKTTLLAEWIEAYEGQVAWLSLDEQDNQIVRFWRYFVTALQTLSKNLGQTSLQMLETGQDFEPEPFLSALVNDLTYLDDPIILVLDDYHVISAQEIHAGLTFLLDHIPPSLHLVIATRADPLLPISRLRVRGRLTELRVADLRFNDAEAAVFLNTLMKLGLSETDIHALEERTEGWIAGLQLAALSMQGLQDTHAFIQAFTGRQYFVLEYLVDEVLRRQPQALQQFLIETSILNRMCAPLCDAVTGISNSEMVLDDLHRRNLFLVPLDGEHFWFRYHHLFADFLKSHLSRTRTNDLPALHRRAAQWYQLNNYPEDALRHAFAIPDYAYVSSLVVDNWRSIYHQGRLETAVQWLESLPQDFILQSPPLGVAYCWTLFIRGDYDRIAAFLDEIMQVFHQKVEKGMLPIDHPEYNIILHQVILLRAVVLRHQGDVNRAIIEIEQLLPKIEELRQSLGQLYADMGFTACYSQLGYTYLAANDLDRAADYLSRVSGHARNCNNFFALAHATMEWIRICLLQGNIDQAEKIGRYEMSLADQPAYADYPAFCLIRLALADVLRVKNLMDEAAMFLHDGLETARKSGHVYYLAKGYLIAARYHQAKGKTLQIQEDLQNAEKIAETIHNRFLDEAISQAKKELEEKAITQQSLIEPLSERELEVLKLICVGKSNQEIADELVIAIDTVKRHVNNIYGKMGVKRRSQAILDAYRLNLV